MKTWERAYQLHKILSHRRTPISALELEQRLNCSRSTLTRLISHLRDDFGAPIECTRDGLGYRYTLTDGNPFELPGLWFSAAELHALLVLQKLLGASQPRLFESLLSPLRQRLERLLNLPRWGLEPLGARVRIIGHGNRQPNPESFDRAASALLERRRLEIDYDARGSGQDTRRLLSPQRLIHYRDNWYLDAWCHEREALRTFSLDRLRAPKVLTEPALEIADADLDAHFTGGYGIFGGAVSNVAVLRFTAERARWVSAENWHPSQTGEFLADGRYELSLPYSDPRELIMDILRYGPDVEVVAPDDLRDAVAKRLRLALEQYAEKI